MPADHGDDEQVDRGTDRHRVGIDLTVPPDVDDPGEAGDEAGEGERQRAVQRHVEPERGHPDRVVTDAFERHTERRAAHARKPTYASTESTRPT